LVALAVLEPLARRPGAVLVAVWEVFLVPSLASGDRAVRSETAAADRAGVSKKSRNISQQSGSNRARTLEA
jgi:hypothetical protein